MFGVRRQTRNGLETSLPLFLLPSLRLSLRLLNLSGRTEKVNSELKARQACLSKLLRMKYFHKKIQNRKQKERETPNTILRIHREKETLTFEMAKKKEKK
jgi:hypothetical protein